MRFSGAGWEYDSIMAQEQKKPTKESPGQRDAFLIYFNLRDGRSGAKVRKELGKKGTKISLRSIEKWMSQYKWVERVQVMDQEVSDKAEQMAIKEATTKKSDILKACKNTMIRYNQALLSGDLVPTATDFRKMWEIMRIEMGKTIGQDTMPMPSPAVNIFLTKNEKVIKVVRESQEELRKVLEGEIKEEKT